MDTLSVMNTFGWTSERAMAGYTRLLSEDLRSSYAHAMDQIELEASDESMKPTSIEAYFDAEERTK